MRRAFLNKLRPRHFNIAGLVLCAVIAAPLGLVRINPLLRPRSAAAAEGSRLTEMQQGARRLRADIAAQRRSLADLREELERERQSLQPARHVNDRIARLTELAAGNGLQVDEILPGQPAPGPRCDLVPIRLRGNGTYPACAAFLRQLARALPDISVVSMELSADPQKPSKPATFLVSLTWFATTDGSD